MLYMLCSLERSQRGYYAFIVSQMVSYSTLLKENTAGKTSFLLIKFLEFMVISVRLNPPPVHTRPSPNPGLKMDF